MNAEYTSTVNITGGAFGPAPLGFNAQDSGIINIYGTGLQFSGGDIVGTLQGGQTIDASYQILGSGQINLINAPEPGTVVMLCGGLAALAWKRRRRGAQTRP